MKTTTSLSLSFQTKSFMLLLLFAIPTIVVMMCSVLLFNTNTNTNNDSIYDTSSVILAKTNINNNIIIKQEGEEEEEEILCSCYYDDDKFDDLNGRIIQALSKVDDEVFPYFDSTESLQLWSNLSNKMLDEKKKNSSNLEKEKKKKIFGSSSSSSSSSIRRSHHDDDDDQQQSSLSFNLFSCESYWMMNVLEESLWEDHPTSLSPHVIVHHLSNVTFIGIDKTQQPIMMDTIFSYQKDDPHLPKILYLGDSISIQVCSSMIMKMRQQQQQQQVIKKKGGGANIHWAHGNCLEFDKYKEFLHSWIGTNNPPWDIIQFNIGHHYHHYYWKNDSNNRTTTTKILDFDKYRSELSNIFERLRILAPTADIIFALTTPSPFDSSQINITRSVCHPQSVYDKLTPRGDAQKLNQIATEVAYKYNATINDRYNLMLNNLPKYQWTCNIHFNDDGYDYIAKHDWKVAMDILKKRRRRGGARK